MSTGLVGGLVTILVILFKFICSLDRNSESSIAFTVSESRPRWDDSGVGAAALGAVVTLFALAVLRVKLLEDAEIVFDDADRHMTDS